MVDAPPPSPASTSVLARRPRCPCSWSACHPRPTGRAGCFPGARAVSSPPGCPDWPWTARTRAPVLSSSRSPAAVASDPGQSPGHWQHFGGRGPGSGAVVRGEAPKSTTCDIRADKCRSLAKSLVFPWDLACAHGDLEPARPPLENNEVAFGWERTRAFPSRRDGAGGVRVWGRPGSRVSSRLSARKWGAGVAGVPAGQEPVSVLRWHFLKLQSWEVSAMR